MARERVFVDTNVIVEAFRIGCWSTISNRYAIETVEKCAAETQSGDRALGWLDAVVCLEDLASASGSPKAQIDRLERHHRGEWLSSLKTRILLGIYP